MKCPKCGETVDLSKTECPKCGVIYVKAFAKLAEKQELTEAPKDHSQEEEHQPKNIKNWTDILPPIRVGIPIILVVLLISGMIIKFNKKPDTSSNNISSDTIKTSTDNSSSVVAISKTISNPEASSKEKSQVKELDNLSETTNEKSKACSDCVSGGYKMVKDQDGFIYVANLGDCITLCEAAIESHGMLDEEFLKYFELPKKEFELFVNNHRNTYEKAQKVSSSGSMLVVDIDASRKIIFAITGDEIVEKLKVTDDKPGREKVLKYFSQIDRLRELSEKLLEQRGETHKRALKGLKAMK